MKATALLSAALLGASLSAALARDIYCDMKGGGSTDRVREWFVVNEKVRTPQLPGSKKASIGCSITFNSVGGIYRPMELVTKPKLGEVKLSYGRIAYRSSKSGEDFVSVRMHEATRTGGTQTLIFQYRIHVVDRPL